MTSLIRKFKESRRKATAERKRQLRKFAEKKAVSAGRLVGDPLATARIAGRGTKKIIKAGVKVGASIPKGARQFQAEFRPPVKRRRRR